MSLASVIIFIYRVILQLIRLYSFIWFIWIVLSWLSAFRVLNINYYNPVIRILANITDGVIEKVFGRFRERLIVGMIDLSPFVFLMILTTVIPYLLSRLINIILRLL